MADWLRRITRRSIQDLAKIDVLIVESSLLDADAEIKSMGSSISCGSYGDRAVSWLGEL
jgi:hypothetical protein